jgi:hypothetical protein
MTNDTLAQVRWLKTNGRLSDIQENEQEDEEIKLLARFALEVLEQKAIGCPYSNDQPVYALPPVPVPDDVGARAERAAAKVLSDAIDSEGYFEYKVAVEIIKTAINGE